MKKINTLIAVVLFTLGFTSCSTEEVILQEGQSTELLKTYELKRDATGAYSVALNVNSDVVVDVLKNSDESSNEFYLSKSKNVKGDKINSASDLWFKEENFKVEFISENSNKVPTITVFDDNIKFSNKSGKNKKFLNEYSISKNEDGTFDLDFNVNDKVAVDFVYNEELATHEIHLDKGKSSKNNFSRTLEKEEGKLLKIDFVNHSNNSNAKAAAVVVRKPRVIVDDGEDY
ncbi:hypothetical protein [Polaribacter ponticola]|uniref:Lipoprotein n=1 Tax=Polaribacter ponticola TaxID=2978475 RepID=A0ABT5S5V6_9FLAO|nr:hypothetical protein [Polaribacter sp. MSW5]MDD7913484.1 hypothetical protein [Polaribacter sp. MSW5]